MSWWICKQCAPHMITKVYVVGTYNHIQGSNTHNVRRKPLTLTATTGIGPPYIQLPGVREASAWHISTIYNNRLLLWWVTKPCWVVHHSTTSHCTTTHCICATTSGTFHNPTPILLFPCATKTMIWQKNTTITYTELLPISRIFTTTQITWQTYMTKYYAIGIPYIHPTYRPIIGINSRRY